MAWIFEQCQDPYGKCIRYQIITILGNTVPSLYLPSCFCSACTPSAWPSASKLTTVSRPSRLLSILLLLLLSSVCFPSSNKKIYILLWSSLRSTLTPYWHIPTQGSTCWPPSTSTSNSLRRWGWCLLCSRCLCSVGLWCWLFWNCWATSSARRAMESAIWCYLCWRSLYTLLLSGLRSKLSTISET